MAKSNKLVKVGVWAFILGMLVAILAGFIGPWATPILVLVGLVVGFLNVGDKETNAFLVASVSIMIAAFTAGGAIATNLATLGAVGMYLVDLLNNINVFVFPATIVVALKAIYSIARD